MGNERSALSIFLGELENDVLCEMVKVAQGLGAAELAPLFDGVILQMIPVLDLGPAADETFRKFGVMPIIKFRRVDNADPCRVAAASEGNDEGVGGNARFREDLFSKVQRAGNLVKRMESGSRMCLPGAVLNVVPDTTWAPMDKFGSSGPFTYRHLPRWLDGAVSFVAVRDTALLQPGAFVLHYDGHAAGVKVGGGFAEIFDARQVAAGAIPTEQLLDVLSGANAGHVVFAVHFGSFQSVRNAEGSSEGDRVGDFSEGGGNGLLDLHAGYRKSVEDLPRYGAKKSRKTHCSNIDDLLKKTWWFRPSPRSRTAESHLCHLCGSGNRNSTSHRRLFRELDNRELRGEIWGTSPNGRRKQKVIKEAKTWRKKGVEKAEKSDWIWKSTPGDGPEYTSSGGNAIPNEMHGGGIPKRSKFSLSPLDIVTSAPLELLAILGTRVSCDRPNCTGAVSANLQCGARACRRNWGASILRGCHFGMLQKMIILKMWLEGASVTSICRAIGPKRNAVIRAVSQIRRAIGAFRKKNRKSTGSQMGLYWRLTRQP